MNSQLAGTPAGHQRPRISWVPEFISSTGAEAAEVCRRAGLHLDPWQQFVIDRALGERADGQWAAFEVGVCVSRQNGKGGLLEARELAGLFVLGERLIIHSAHQFDTSLEAFRRLLELIENAPDLERRIRRVSRSHGEEGIELKGGQRIRFRTRTKGGGRGFSGDCLILDEAMILPESAHGALLPTLSARPNPQVWYTGSAVDQEVHEFGVVFARVRHRAIKGDDPSLAYFEWSPVLTLGEIDERSAQDPNVWAEGNPGLGIRITADYVAKEQRSMTPRGFAVERLGAGDWPDVNADDEGDITISMWRACEDVASRSDGRRRLAFDVRPDRTAATIAAAGIRADGLRDIEVLDHHAGTGWVPGRLSALAEEFGPVIFDERSPAAAMVKRLEDVGVQLEPVNGSEYARACGDFFDDVDQQSLRHRGQPELDAAVRGAAKRPLGDAWAWSRKNSAVDISPLVACTLARWAVTGGRTSAYEDNDLLVV